MMPDTLHLYIVCSPGVTASGNESLESFLFLSGSQRSLINFPIRHSICESVPIESDENPRICWVEEVRSGNTTVLLRLRAATHSR